MLSLYYEVTFGISLALSLLYAMMWHKHFDVHITLLFVLIPITNLGYLQMTNAQNLQAALDANKIVYIGGCFLLLFIMLSVLTMCRIRVPRWTRAGLILLTAGIFCSILTAGQTPYYYKQVSFDLIDGTGILHKEYGFMHTVFYIMVILYLSLTVAALVYSFIRKKDVSNRILYLLTCPVVISVISYFAGAKLRRTYNIDPVPATYVMAQIVYLIIIRRVSLYDITDTGIDSLVRNGDTGFISFDFRHRYIGSNETAKGVFPILKELTVDKSIDSIEFFQDNVLQWLRKFEEDEKNDISLYEHGGKTFMIDVNYLYNGHRKKGYQLFLKDDTKNQAYISLLNRFNFSLRTEVQQKTAHILEMHDKLILSMAAMVESRDNSTGGHIRRTSDCIRILTDVMRETGGISLSDQFIRHLIKAAPMHDLGKIAVDDAVLRKPGRFTDEEFEIMKTHAAEGARIVHNIVQGTDDPEFQRIAENVAHYHHERWDGSGYPQGLRGEEIPLEARIMAIADVYDALVSKRVYKESMSFEKADQIMIEGMGRHFDQRLEPFYIAARPRLEEYYRSLAD